MSNVCNPHRSNTIDKKCLHKVCKLFGKTMGTQNFDRAIIVIFERDNSSNEIMKKTLDFVSFDDDKRLEPNQPLLLFIYHKTYSRRILFTSWAVQNNWA